MKIIRLKQVVNMTGLSKSTICRLEKKELFPRRRMIGCAAIGWLQSDIELWMSTRPTIK